MSFGQTALAVQLLGQTHFVGVGQQLVGYVANVGESAGFVVGYGLAQLLQAEFHVVEVGDGLHQCLRDVYKVGLEFAEGAACVAGVFRVNDVECQGIGYEGHHAPVVFAVEKVGFRRIFHGGKEMEHAAVNVGGSLGFELAAQVACHGRDVALQSVHVGENMVVYALQHIIGCIGTFGRDLIGVVDQAGAERLYFGYFTFDGEMLHNVVESIHFSGYLRLIFTNIRNSPVRGKKILGSYCRRAARRREM